MVRRTKTNKNSIIIVVYYANKAAYHTYI